MSSSPRPQPVQPPENPIERQLPDDETRQRYELSADLVTISDSRPTEAEAIRTVRTHMVARHLEDGRRGLSVAAPTSGVGCTYTAVNLAVALSQVGISTLLIDADLRAPRVEEFIRPEIPTQGLRQFLAEEDGRLHAYVHSDVLPNLSVLYAGGTAEYPQELLSGEPFKRLVDRCLRDFQFTVIDTPAADLGADAVQVASIVGYTLVVARANVTLLSQLSDLASQLHEDGARVVGTVLSEI
ncbi:MAG: CpsD/CapB family tyrosine-protein kinase [Phenylobacterium sp.]|uniref:CpsD/CapB family tyrosine-protein kinase n=1 Tax=Phenylobacterium sp. TaxID=1871053 RepID=UPI001A60AE74|nr:CpsD/CapB family tyrosine-protein kinase [Phenylobacterium sp.]MBL8770972.1 CpsD/CapB family tyrosine-protein kinase [Phenylobacterium sp.]